MTRRLHSLIVWLVVAIIFLAGCGQSAAPTIASTVSAGPPTQTPAATIAPTTSGAVSVSIGPTAIATTTSAATTSGVVPAAQPTATPVPPIPVKLQVPAINVNAPVELVGLTSDGAMDVPKQWNDVGWYEYGPTPGQVGNSAIAGHLDSTTAPAVFWRLGTLKPGDKITVTLSDNQNVAFVVKEKDSYAYNDAPINQIFGPAATANLNLITCGGSWDAFTKNYSNRIVVYATKA